MANSNMDVKQKELNIVRLQLDIIDDEISYARLRDQDLTILKAKKDNLKNKQSKIAIEYSILNYQKIIKDKKYVLKKMMRGTQ